MGIPGLTRFVDCYFAGWEQKRINGRLIIDGNNLMHCLYNMDWSNGGQYPEYRERVGVFFTALRVKGVDPLVVFDGIDHKEQKTDTSMKRRQERLGRIQIKIGSHYSRQLQCYHGILPTLCSSVIKMALKEFGVCFCVADGEGDETIAQLANHYCCPVLSEDSDFFVFRLKGGYIPYNRFHWESNPINAEIYFLDVFAKEMKFQDVALCYAIPAIFGNDFLPPCNLKSMNSIYHCIFGDISNNFKAVCKCLSGFPSLDLFIESPLGSCLKEKCLDSLELYSIPRSQSSLELLQSTVLKSHDGKKFPKWLIDLFRHGYVPSAAMKAAVLKKVLFDVVPDNFQKQSSLVCSRSIRQHVYALLNCECVTEYIRHSMNIQGDRVTSVPLSPPLTLDFVECTSTLERRDVCFNTLHCNENIMSNFMPQYSDWQLVVAATMFWVKHTNVPMYITKGLLLCFVICHDLYRSLKEIRHNCTAPVQFRRSKQWLDTLHAFAEWQSTYHSAITLNAVLMLPLKVISLASLYDGQIAMFLASSQNIDEISSTFNIDRKLYQLLKEVVITELAPKSSPKTEEVNPVQPKKTATKKCMPPQSKFAHTNRFALLQLDSDSEEEN